MVAYQHQYELNEGFKALLDGIFSDKEVANKLKIAFEEVVNDRATTQKANLEKLKDEALEQIKNELLTKDVFQAEVKAIEAKIDAEIKAIEAKIAETKQELKQEIAETKQELKQEIVEVRTEIAEVRTEIAEVRTEIAVTKQELKQEIAEVRQELKVENAEIKSNIRSIRQEFKFYAIGLGALIILLQPKVFDFIVALFGK